MTSLSPDVTVAGIGIVGPVVHGEALKQCIEIFLNIESTKPRFKFLEEWYHANYWCKFGNFSYRPKNKSRRIF